MLNVVIYGYNEVSKGLKNFIYQKYNPVMVTKKAEELNVVAYAQHETVQEKMVDDVPLLKVTKLNRFFQQHFADILIIPRENYIGQENYLQIIHFMGVDFNQVWIAQPLVQEVVDDVRKLFIPFFSYPYLPYLEFHIADQCNLNCAACEHYAGLVKEPHFPDFSRFERDLRQLKKYIEGIGMIRIMGGEPLLNKNIGRYVKLTRQLYPQAVIYVVTNGLLAMNMPEEFYALLKQQKIRLWISFYLPLKDKMEKIYAALKSKGVAVEISPLNHKFTKKQRLHPRALNEAELVFWNCFQHSCNNLYEGKLAACFLPFTTKYFNQYFGKHIPEDGGIDLYDETLTLKKLKQQLITPFARCCYCDYPQEMDWRVIQNPSTLEDWILDDK